MGADILNHAISRWNESIFQQIDFGTRNSRLRKESEKMSSAVQRLQKQLTQLREEAKVERIPVSQAIEVMKSYITEHTQGDALVIGVNQSENPFRDQKSCAIL